MNTYVGFWLGPFWKDVIKVFDKLDIIIVAAIVIIFAYMIIGNSRNKVEKESM